MSTEHLLHLPLDKLLPVMLDLLCLSAAVMLEMFASSVK